MVRALIALLTLSLPPIPMFAADHNVGGGDKFPKDVKIGETLKFDRPSVGGRNSIEVKVNGKAIKGKMEIEIVDGKPLIGGGKMKYEVKAEKAGTLEIEITITPIGEKGETKKHKVEVKE